MGPPPFGDGNKTWSVRCTPFSRALQWGHRLSAMETGQLRFTLQRIVLWLQWGHRLSAMETWAMSRANIEVQKLQWGHRLSAMETRRAMLMVVSVKG